MKKYFFYPLRQAQGPRKMNCVAARGTCKCGSTVQYLRTAVNYKSTSNRLLNDDPACHLQIVILYGNLIYPRMQIICVKGQVVMISYSI